MTTGSAQFPPDLATLALRLQGLFPWRTSQQEVGGESGHEYGDGGWRERPLRRALWMEGRLGEEQLVGQRWQGSVKQLAAAYERLEEVGG